MPAARCEVVIAVQDRGALRVEESARPEGVEDAGEERRRPAVEYVAGDREMVRTACGNAIQLAIQPHRIAGMPDVQI
jgi:hypothetical protein